MLRIFRNLSLDVVLGALASGSMVVRLTDLHMPFFWWLVLPISVWVIYTADHLLDAWRLKGAAHTDRHLFHHNHFQSIFVAWILFASACLILAPVPAG